MGLNGRGTVGKGVRRGVMRKVGRRGGQRRGCVILLDVCCVSWRVPYGLFFLGGWELRG